MDNIIMSKIKLEDYEKIEKINLEQQKALRENAKHIAMKEIQEKNEEDIFIQLESHKRIGFYAVEILFMEEL